MLLPLGAVGVAELAHPHAVRVFPDERVLLPGNTLRAARDAVQPIFVVKTLRTIVRTLQTKTATFTPCSSGA